MNHFDYCITELDTKYKKKGIIILMKKLIIFDLDGTLVDTRDCILRALNELSVEFKYKKPTAEDIVKLRDTRSLHFLKVLGVSFWRWPSLIKRIQKMLSKEIAQMDLISGLDHVLHELKDAGATLGIITSNSSENMNLFFDKYHGKYFDVKYADVFAFGKARALKKLVRKRGFDLEHTYYIGDETRDILAARSAGVKVVAVSWGFNTKEILKAMKPNFVANTPSELLNYLKSNS